MIRLIKSHNELNGLKFVTFEFGLMAVFLTLFGAYCLLAQKFAVGLVFGGIGLNCLPVVYYALRSLKTDQTHAGTIWDAQARSRLMAENPHMLRDTLMLAGATLVPFLVLVLLLVEVLRGKAAS